jgi:hypothetical protein
MSIELALRRVERAAQELRNARLDLLRLTESEDAELEAFLLHADDGPRLRVIDGGPAHAYADSGRLGA